jgi:two-component system response regulator WspF
VDYPFRPSVNVFFESAAAHWKTPGVAVLLTGMGNDGARGLAALRQAGWLTIAQDEASSVAYGMPRAAAEMHAASRIMPLSQIPAAILTRFTAMHAQRF